MHLFHLLTNFRISFKIVKTASKGAQRWTVMKTQTRKSGLKTAMQILRTDMAISGMSSQEDCTTSRILIRRTVIIRRDLIRRIQITHRMEITRRGLIRRTAVTRRIRIISRIQIIRCPPMDPIRIILWIRACRGTLIIISRLRQNRRNQQAAWQLQP